MGSRGYLDVAPVTGFQAALRRSRRAEIFHFESNARACLIPHSPSDDYRPRTNPL